MKKLLAMLGTVSAFGGLTSSVISCDQPTPTSGNNTDGENNTGEEVVPDQDLLDKLKENPSDLSLINNQIHLEFKNTTIAEAEKIILDKINESVKVFTLKISADDLEFNYDRTFVKKKQDAGKQPGDIDRNIPESYLIAGDKISVKVISENNALYFKNNADIVVEKFDLAESPFVPKLGQTVREFITDVQNIYLDKFEFGPDFYSRLDMVFIDSNGVKTEVASSAVAETLTYKSAQEKCETKALDDDLYIGTTIFQVKQ